MTRLTDYDFDNASLDLGKGFEMEDLKNCPKYLAQVKKVGKYEKGIIQEYQERILINLTKYLNEDLVAGQAYKEAFKDKIVEILKKTESNVDTEARIVMVLLKKDDFYYNAETGEWIEGEISNLKPFEDFYSEKESEYGELYVSGKARLVLFSKKPMERYDESLK